VQFGLWLWRALHGDLGSSIATGRPVLGEVIRAVSNTVMLAIAAAIISFLLGLFFGLVAGYFRDSWIDKVATSIAISGVSLPHYWLGMVLVIIFSVELNWLPAVGAGPSGSGAWEWDWAHLRFLVLPAITTSVIPMGIITRTVRALTGDILNQDFVEALRAKGLRETQVFRHVLKNAAPTALAVMGLQLGYMLGGSILIETVFSWPGSGLLLNSAIFQRDLPLLQGTILVLAMFFVILNLLVDIAQAAIDPRIKRG
jgi:peptide/nickel transport system permease protein